MNPINEPQRQNVEEKKLHIFFWEKVKDFFVQLMNIRQDTDRESTIESIKADISFRGHTSWILICSIFIASLGLNANSTAVIIGAMLISPLMGPILGMALALAINDVDLLRRAVKNFGIMVALSVTSAFIFFWLFPLRDTSSELLARTSPDIRDVLIAFFGGLALTIARAKKGTVASVIYGVAIATALMPPLCTVGFFLAVGSWKLALGALYLFLINTIFIGLATFVVLRLIKLPMANYETSSKRKRLSRIAYICAGLIMIPAGYTFYEVWRVSQFKNSAAAFIRNNIEKYEFSGNGRFLKDFSKIEYNNGEPYIQLVFFGDTPIPEEVQTLWNNQKEQYPYLKNAKLHLLNDTKEKDQSEYIQELYSSSKQQLISSQERIALLQKEVEHLGQYSREASKFEEISKEIAINYDKIASVSFANELQSDFNRIDTVPVFRIRWKEAASEEDKARDAEKLKRWLNARLKIKKVSVKEEK